MQRIPSLDGLRAISITLVILSHMGRRGNIDFVLPTAYGELGVRIFFVLSGYLITNLLLREYEQSSTISLRDFYLRRGFRIFPAALVFLAIISLAYWRQIGWYHLAAALFYAANMDASRPQLMGHLWSLSIEEQFYLLWPFVLKRWHRHKTAILVGVMLLTPIFRAALHAGKAEGGILGSLPVFADQLAIGCLLAIFAPRLPKIPIYFAVPMVAAIIFIPLFPATSAGRTLFSLFVLEPVLHLSIAGIVLHVIQVPYRALNWVPIAWLGKVSYSLYLWQQVFCSNPALRLGPLGAALALACACLSYYFVEQPMLRLRERWTRKPDPTLALGPNSLAA